jgi:prepilin-type processing-associated H-X9-DG protein
MIACGKHFQPNIFKRLACLVGAAGFVGSPVLAQDCKVSVQATPQVLYGAQSASVNVLAHFPSPPAPNAPYAFASALFDVHASNPMWTSASAGAIVGNDVLGINVSQAHSPQTGMPADPSNPFRLWHGTFAAQSDAPALVEIAADPTDFSVYPSKLTSSSAPREADGGNDFILVNPLSVARGRWLAAPGPGTAIQTHDDVVIDGRIITGENFDSASIGLLPAGSITTSSMRVAFVGQPHTFTVTVQSHAPQRSRVNSVTVTFDGLENGGYVGGANFAFADGSVRSVRFDGFLGGVYVATGDLGDKADGEIPALVVDSLPQTINTRTGAGTRSTGALLNLAAANTYTGTTVVLCYDRPVVATVRGPDGRPRTLTLDRIDVHGVREAAARMQSANNLKQMTLGCHVLAADGVEQMSITPLQAE